MNDPVLDSFDDEEDNLMLSAGQLALSQSGQYGVADDSSDDDYRKYTFDMEDYQEEPRYKLDVLRAPPSPVVQRFNRMAPARPGRPDRVQMKGHADENSRGVKYVATEQARAKYRVQVGDRLRRRGMLLDTGSIRRHFKQKDRAGLGKAGLGRATLTQGVDRDLEREWNRKGLIWVCADGPGPNEAAFYTHVGKIDRFHHSTFFSGNELIGAGEWIVEDGRLKSISANSGHYQPSIDFLYQSVLHLRDAWQDDTTVLVWDIQAGSWVNVPVRDFGNGLGGGRWKANPRQ